MGVNHGHESILEEGILLLAGVSPVEVFPLSIPEGQPQHNCPYVGARAPGLGHIGLGGVGSPNPWLASR